MSYDFQLPRFAFVDLRGTDLLVLNEDDDFAVVMLDSLHVAVRYSQELFNAGRFAGGKVQEFRDARLLRELLINAETHGATHVIVAEDEGDLRAVTIAEAQAGLQRLIDNESAN